MSQLLTVVNYGIQSDEGPALSHEYFFERSAGNFFASKNLNASLTHNGIIDCAEDTQWKVASFGRPKSLVNQCGHRESSDFENPSQLVLAMLGRAGCNTAQYLTGPFFFVAVNFRKAQIVVSRGMEGGCPIYFCKEKGRVIFSNNIKTLVGHCTKDLDKDFIDALSNFHPTEDAKSTYYENIKLLPVGHTLVIDQHGVSLTRWWTGYQTTKVDIDPVAALRTAIVSAVHDSLSRDQNIGVCLSGGLDSAAIACIAARELKLRGQSLTCFSSVLPTSWRGPEKDERDHIQAVLDQEENIDIVWVQLPVEHDWLSEVDAFHENFAHPPFSSITHIDSAFGQAAKDQRLSGLLSGFGGDFCASWRGVGVSHALMRQGKLGDAFAHFVGVSGSDLRSYPRMFWREICKPLLRDLSRYVRYRSGDASDFRHLHPHEAMAFVMEPGRVELSINQQSQFYEMRFGLSLQFPLLDPRVIKSVMGASVRELQKNGQMRSLFRRAMEGILPESVRLRDDKGAAFDPLLTSRIIASRSQIEAWIAANADASWWDWVDREGVLRELQMIVPACRDQWRPEMFGKVLQPLLMARFLAWHSEQGPGQHGYR